jgi:hypothetical protein
LSLSLSSLSLVFLSEVSGEDTESQEHSPQKHDVWVVIDASNVAHYGQSQIISVQAILSCVGYWLQKGCRVVAFGPNWWIDDRNNNKFICELEVLHMLFEVKSPYRHSFIIYEIFLFIASDASTSLCRREVPMIYPSLHGHSKKMGLSSAMINLRTILNSIEFKSNGFKIGKKLVIINYEVVNTHTDPNTYYLVVQNR